MLVKKYRFYNNIAGWIIFAISTFTFLSTIEPTTSFWDCGEFIASAFNLEVGHPPGAPFFMLLGRLFSAFSGPESAAMMINIMSGLCSAFTILFLFWSITAFAKKMATLKDDLSPAKIIAILGSGVVGALAYNFSDSFWFSAVEGEVYAMSSFFTAIVFWAILKWEAVANQKHNARWLILIGYLMGLSIGVHLLNLLTIPAICLIYYFKKFKYSFWGLITTGIVSVIILGVIQGLLIPGIVTNAASAELIAVNSWGFNFNTGTLIFSLLLVTSIVVALFLSSKRKLNEFVKIGLILSVFVILLLTTGWFFSILWLIFGGISVAVPKLGPPVYRAINTVVLIITVIIIGYSTFAVISIRSAANTPMDENNPENVFTLLSYLNREQYGDRPLFSGQYWNTPYQVKSNRSGYVKEDGKPVYTQSYSVYEKSELKKRKPKRSKSYISEFEANQFIAENGNNYVVKQEYVVSDDKKNSILVFDPKYTTIFPRMYSSQAHHIRYYKQWSGYDVSSQKSRRDHKRVLVGYNQDRSEKYDYIPTFSENLKFFRDYQVGWMYWRYFMWNFAGRQNDVQSHGFDLLNGNWISGVDFIDEQKLGNRNKVPKSMTSNKGHNKFYLLPLLLGLIGLFYQLVRDTKNWMVVMLLFLLTGLAIIVYLNFPPVQPRERDYAYVGSFYAFAIWIGLGVYSLFDAVTNMDWKKLGIAAGASIGFSLFVLALQAATGSSKVFSLSLVYMSFVAIALLTLMVGLRSIKNKRIPAMLAVAIGLIVPILMAQQGWDDHDRSHRFTARDFAKNYLMACEENAILFSNGDNDTFPLWYAQEVEGFRRDVRVVNLSLLNTDWYINQMRRKAYDSDPVPFSIDEEKYRQGTRDVVVLRDGADYRDLNEMIDYVSDDTRTDNTTTDYGSEMFTIPTKKFKFKVDKAKARENGAIPAEYPDSLVVDEIRWGVGSSFLYKNSLMLMDLIATNNDWERPIYFAVTTGQDSYIGLQNHFQLEGLTYRLTPINTPNSGQQPYSGRIDTDKMYANLMENFVWGGLDGEHKLYMDENNLRMTTNLRLQFDNLIKQLIAEGKKDMAEKAIDRCLEVMPEKNVPYTVRISSLMSAYYAVDAIDKGNKLRDRLYEIFSEDFDYYMSLEPKYYLQIETPGGQDYYSPVYQTLSLLRNLAVAYQEYGDSASDEDGVTKASIDYDEKFQEHYADYMEKAEEVQQYQRKKLRKNRR